MFKHVISSDDVKRGKPNSEGIIKILNKTKTKKVIQFMLVIASMIIKQLKMQI